MASPAEDPSRVYRFGPFEADVARRELRKNGFKVRLEHKPWQLLMVLLERPGEIVSRAEIERRLWPDGVFVDFEHGVNVAVKKLRQALLDSAASPRYIETVVSEGYRFIGILQEIRPVAEGEPVRASMTPAAAPDGPAATTQGSPRWRGSGWQLAAVTLGFALIGASAWSLTHLRRVLPLHERDWVLIAGFENRTGEELLEGTLPAALERELSNSEFLSVTPRERVEDALRLMRRPATDKLNTEEAREVCLRDGGIQALVTGRTEKVGATYVLSAEIIDPVKNLRLAADSETASGKDQIWPAVRRLSNWVRETLGESMERIDSSNRQLEKATTPSLRALQLFTAADSASRRGEWAISAELTRQALVEDSGFASAHLWLAYALNNLNKPEWKQEVERAVALSGTASERERYFILGGYELLTGHPDQSLAPLETLVRRYPDHYFAYSNLANAYQQLGRLEEGGELAARFADARPHDPSAVAGAVLRNENVDLARARRYAQRAVELGTDSTAQVLQANTLLFHAHDLWMQDDAKGVFAELQRIMTQSERWSDPVFRRVMKSAVATIYLTLGRFETSQQLFDSPGTDQLWHNEVTFFRGRSTSLVPEGSEPRYPNFFPWLRAEFPIRQGQFAEAAALLQPEFDRTYGKRRPEAHWIANRLVIALEQSGNSQKALAILEQISSKRIWINPLNGNLGYGAFWLRNQARLSAYYHRLGREREARRIDNQLRRLLAVADPDHPILRQLNGQ